MHQPKRILILAVVLLAAAAQVTAQGWGGSIGAAYLWQSVDGNSDSFASQYNLGEGLELESLDLDYRGEGAVDTFSLEAWGFGNASPAAAARFRLELGAGIGVTADYDHRESFFKLAGGDWLQTAEDWELDRFRAAVTLDAWRPVRVSLLYRSLSTDGLVNRPSYALNERYPVAIDLDESVSEWTLRLETRTLPVRIQLEQSLADYERANRPFATGSPAIGGDPDSLEDIESTIVNEQNGVSTTRVVASYSSRVVEGAASLLWRSAELESSGAFSETFGIGGGAIGTLQRIDTVMSAADQETLAGTLSLGFRLAPRWVLRVAGDYRDGSADSSLVGERVLSVISSTGSPVLSAPLGDSGYFDFTDSSGRLTIEYRGDRWTAWAGGSASSRDVSWQLSGEQPPYDASRDGSGYLAGAMWSPSKEFELRVELERGDFDDLIFRVDPETADKATLRLRSQLGRGWQLQLHGRRVSASNDADQADLDSSSTPFGAAASWTSASGLSGLGLDLEHYDIETDTLVLLPDGRSERSIYDLDLDTFTLHGFTRGDVFGINGALTYLEDGGSSWPLDSWTGRLRVTLYGSHGLEYSALAQYWSYDEQLSELDDFDVFRYGLAVSWRF